MSTVIRLADRRSSRRFVYFTRTELNLLLSLYSRRVAAGEWRDYAIDHDRGLAAFSVFQHSRDQALFSVVKEEDAEKRCLYRVAAGPRRLGSAASLRDALNLFEPRLRLVRGSQKPDARNQMPEKRPPRPAGEAQRGEGGRGASAPRRGEG